MGTGCSVAVAHGRRNFFFFWLKGPTPVTVGWFAIRNTWNNLESELMCNFLELLHPHWVYNQLGSGFELRQNTTVVYPIYYADDNMFRPLWAVFRSQKCI